MKSPLSFLKLWSLGEWGIAKDSPAGRKRFAQCLEQRRGQPGKGDDGPFARAGVGFGIEQRGRRVCGLAGKLHLWLLCVVV